MVKYGSRKFLITGLGMVCATVLGAMGNMDANVAMVLAAGIAAYNYANVKVTGNGN